MSTTFHKILRFCLVITTIANLIFNCCERTKQRNKENVSFLFFFDFQFYKGFTALRTNLIYILCSLLHSIHFATSPTLLTCRRVSCPLSYHFFSFFVLFVMLVLLYSISIYCLVEDNKTTTRFNLIESFININPYPMYSKPYFTQITFFYCA